MKYQRLNANTLYVSAILFSRSTLHRETLPCLPNREVKLLLRYTLNDEFYDELTSAFTVSITCMCMRLAHSRNTAIDTDQRWIPGRGITNLSDYKMSVNIAFVLPRRQLKQYLDITMMGSLLESSEDSSSSSDEELATLAVICELAFAPTLELGPKLNLDDLSPIQCEQLFR